MVDLKPTVSEDLAEKFFGSRIHGLGKEGGRRAMFDDNAFVRKVNMVGDFPANPIS